MMKITKMTNVKLNKLHLVKKRRIQKYHARKIRRRFQAYDYSAFWNLCFLAFLGKAPSVGKVGKVKVELIYDERP